ncbi:hypothetical protein Q5H92_25975 [Hymenobacter sp. M29]|uniref:Uncharacterized protein n=1 Tax=Hymenobacter mellowenesis TaxID=3063995 RepID=A0ABT9AIZ5_9BACT|nr:hypothetical protein [Hymenobacter sp. M29]MDO7849835.1 hypothetical protein [Hymenobacter sp. M29]
MFAPNLASDLPGLFLSLGSVGVLLQPKLLHGPALGVREIHWRGYLLLGPPGQRKRHPVYWLGEPDWDCDFEDEIFSVNQMPF